MAPNIALAPHYRTLAFVVGFAALYAGLIIALVHSGIRPPLLRCDAYAARPVLLWTSIVSDALIAAAYAAIPFTLYFKIKRKRPDIPFNWVFVAFAVFIFTCGLTHFAEIVAPWVQQGTSGAIFWVVTAAPKIATALASVVTAYALDHHVARQIAGMPTRQQLDAEVDRRVRAEATQTENERVLALLGHELRTPLTPAVGELELLICETTDPCVRHSLHAIKRSVETAAALIAKTLDGAEPPNTAAMHATTAAPVSHHPPTNGADPAKPRLLIVEDHPDTRQTYQRVFWQFGYRNCAVGTVADALSEAREGDFLICDIGLPDGTGHDVMRALAPRGIRGVAVSGYGTPADKDESRAAGFEAHFTKPAIDLTELLKIIKLRGED